MKFVGILKEHEAGKVKIGVSIDTVAPVVDMKDEEIDDIVRYLESGTIVFAFLHYVNDKQGIPICPLIFYTDGSWLWPSYITHYLKEGYYSLLPEEFRLSMRKNEFVVPPISKELKIQAEKMYIDTYEPNRRNRN